MYDKRRRTMPPFDRTTGEPTEGIDTAAPPRTTSTVTPTLVAADALIGYRVINTAGDDLGAIERIMSDIGAGRIPYGVLATGGVLGIGAKLVAVPWNAMRVSQRETAFILDVTAEQIERAPDFNANDP